MLFHHQNTTAYWSHSVSLHIGKTLNSRHQWLEDKVCTKKYFSYYKCHYQLWLSTYDFIFSNRNRSKRKFPSFIRSRVANGSLLFVVGWSAPRTAFHINVLQSTSLSRVNIRNQNKRAPFRITFKPCAKCCNVYLYTSLYFCNLL